MNTPPIRKLTDEETEAGIAAHRFMHLLHHPEKQDRDGEQTDQTHNRAMNDLTGSSVHVPVIVPHETELAITVKLLKPDEVIEKTREIAPWMNRPSQAHKD